MIFARLERVARDMDLDRENRLLRERLRSKPGFGGMIGVSARMQRLRKGRVHRGHAIEARLARSRPGRNALPGQNRRHAGGPSSQTLARFAGARSETGRSVCANWCADSARNGNRARIPCILVSPRVKTKKSWHFVKRTKKSAIYACRIARLLDSLFTFSREAALFNPWDSC